MTQLLESTPAPTAPEISVVQGWTTYVTAIARRLGPYFTRAETRQRVMTYRRGRLSPAARKNSWQLAEETGNATPYGFQYLLARADWAADAVRDERRVYLRPHLSDPHGVIVIDETGFLHKGQHAAGVARPYSGTAGKVENCQIGVCVA
jgi:SRSO17 transposase